MRQVEAEMRLGAVEDVRAARFGQFRPLLEHPVDDRLYLLRHPCDGQIVDHKVPRHFACNHVLVDPDLHHARQRLRIDLRHNASEFLGERVLDANYTKICLNLRTQVLDRWLHFPHARYRHVARCQLRIIGRPSCCLIWREAPLVTWRELLER